jgi:hypothetical protein
MQVRTENCALLGYYAAISSNFLQTFRDKLLSSGFQNQSEVLSYFAAQARNHTKCKMRLRLYIWATHLWFYRTKPFLVRQAVTWLRRLSSDFLAKARVLFQVSPIRICCGLRGTRTRFLSTALVFPWRTTFDQTHKLLLTRHRHYISFANYRIVK